ncbi:transposase [Streptomyces sp. NPDC094458]|uniref:transposase n=1 Tax=unclassified Streptomyces TaxID=2593676 RepID=UPI00331DCAF4
MWRMVRRHELSDEEWDVLSGLLPRTETGRPRRDDRVVLNGIVWKLRTQRPLKRASRKILALTGTDLAPLRNSQPDAGPSWFRTAGSARSGGLLPK